MHEFFADPRASLKNLEEVEECPRVGKMMGAREELTLIFQGLYDRGLVVPLRQEQLLQVKGRPLLNGLFGVGK
eukprot:2261005-Lingulodinium_polyedra.AAC.1